MYSRLRRAVKIPLTSCCCTSLKCRLLSTQKWSENLARFVSLKMESRLQDQLKQHLTDHASTTSRYVVSVFLSLLSAVGTVGNATVLWVFWARRQQVVATLFIVVLAAVDFSTCVIVMPFTVYMELKHFHVQLDAVCKLYQVLCIFVSFLYIPSRFCLCVYINLLQGGYVFASVPLSVCLYVCQITVRERFWTNVLERTH